MTLLQERKAIKKVKAEMVKAEGATRCWNCHDRCTFLFKAFFNTVHKRVGAFCSFTCAAAYARPEDKMHINFECVSRIHTFIGDLPSFKRKKEYGGEYNTEEFSNACKHRYDASPEFYINKKRKLFDRVLMK